MIVRQIDGNNDWAWGKGKNDYKSGVDAIAQSLKTRLQSFLGDCFFDEDAGVDWFNVLGSKDTTEASLAIAQVILNTEDVTRIVDLELNLDENTREVSIRYDVETIYGLSTDIFQLDLGA